MTANYALNDSRAGAGEENGVMYFEAGYSIDSFSAFIGGGDGWHVNTLKKGDYEIVNIGIGAEKEITVSETLSIPMFGQVIINPNSEQYHIVVGISL